MAVPGGASDLFSDICRLCGNQQRDNFNIFGSEGKKRCIQNKIKLKIDIDITQDDPLPKVVCRVCYERLELFCRFQEKCHETQETLMNIFLSVVESCTSDDGAVDETEPNLVFHFVDASSVGQDDEFVTTMMEVPVVSETAEKSQHGSALLNFLTTDRQSELGDIGQLYSYAAADATSVVKRVPVQATPPTTSVVKRESVRPTRPAMTPMSSVTYLVVRKEGGKGPLMSDMLVPVGGIHPNKVPIRRLTKKSNPCDQSAPVPATHGLPPCDATTMANNPSRAKMSRQRKTKPCLTARTCMASNAGVAAGEQAISESGVMDQGGVVGGLAAGNERLLGEAEVELDKDSKLSKKKKIIRIPASRSVRMNVLKVENGQFRCKSCGATFPHNYLCEYHVRTAHTGEKPFACATCGKCFVAMYMLRRHAVAHEADARHLCDACGRRFRSRANLRAHEKTHDAGAPPPYTCITCAKGFYFRTSYLGHLETHGERVQHVCARCGKSYKSRRHLVEHTARVHDGIKRFACAVCEKAFYHRSTLKQHERLHTEERPHGCEECGRAFNDRTNLVRHLKTHTKGRSKRLVPGYLAADVMEELVFS